MYCISHVYEQQFIVFQTKQENVKCVIGSADWVLNAMGKWLALLLCNWEVPVSVVGLKVDVLPEGFVVSVNHLRQILTQCHRLGHGCFILHP
jgi:hypothetical protein